MTKLDTVVVKYVEHYAQYANTEATKVILARGTIQSDSEASTILDVIEAMYARLDEDVRTRVAVYRQPIQAYDADKVAETIVAWVEDSGFEHVTSARGY